MPLWQMETISVLILNTMLCLNVAMVAANFEGIAKSMGMVWAVLAVAVLRHSFSIGIFAVGAGCHATSSWGWNPTVAVHLAASSGICFLMEYRNNPPLFLGPLPFPVRIRRWS
jgi:hypothetical protein